MLLPTLFNMRTMLPRRAGVATASAATTVKMPAGLVVNTPLVESMPLSELVGTRVLLLAPVPHGVTRDYPETFARSRLLRLTVIASFARWRAGLRATTA